ncbi:MAG: hypothetical protein KKB57_06790 [Proteobacteria bacterium]|nr:hypothetical protein [Pseudomonadota bacterium]MBU2469276.1 hypothetical protein [Pseudomonadota bacterium]MBU2517269.1 hypothetical protein [Pseudomonadota bacterium]
MQEPENPAANYNLSLLLHREQPRKAIKLCLKAYEPQPNPRYGYTLAYNDGAGG